MLEISILTKNKPMIKIITCDAPLGLWPAQIGRTKSNWLARLSPPDPRGSSSDWSTRVNPSYTLVPAPGLELPNLGQTRPARMGATVAPPPISGFMLFSAWSEYRFAGFRVGLTPRVEGGPYSQNCCMTPCWRHASPTEIRPWYWMLTFTARMTGIEHAWV